jgi:PAS domain S-box-containing protein
MTQSNLQRNYSSIFIVLLTLAIFVLDESTPLGFGIWELYAVPLWLAFRTPKSSPRLILVIAAMGSLFTLVGVTISRPGGILVYAFFNRGLGALMLWVAGFLLTTARNNEAAARRSEEQLRVSEERYRLLTQAVPSMIYERYSNGGNFFYSDRWYEYTGLTPEQTVGNGWMQALHPEDVERLNRRSAAEKNPAIMHERRMRFRRKDGLYRWMLARSVPVRGDDGEIVRRVGAITDIDDMVRAQDALRESEAQFRAMFEAAVVGQSQANAATGLFTRVNQRFCEMTGYSEAELLRMRPKDLIHPADIADDGRLLPILEGDNDEVVRERRFLRKDGKVIWVNVAVRLLRDSDNKPLRTTTVYLDITRRKRAEVYLERMLDALSLAQHIVAAGVWDLDLVSGEDYISPAYYDLYGLCDHDPMTFERWLACVVDDDREQVTASARLLFESGTEWNMEFRIKHPRRGLRWLASVGRLERDPKGNRLRFTGMDIDITERKQMEAQLRDYVNVLRDADRRKDEFLAMLGHELRNPLHAIRSAVDVLQLAGLPDPEVVSTRNIIDMQVSYMVRLIDDLLDISRLTLDKLELRTDRVRLCDALHEALLATRSLIDAHDLQLEVAISDEALIVEADRVRLTQVFVNLLSNAVKYTPRQGKIWVTARRQNGEAVVSIKDNGIGIPPEKLTHLFDLFYQGHRSLEYATSGLGIGLTLARRLIELHGGRIEVRSEGAGEGSEFGVYLPLLEYEISPFVQERVSNEIPSVTRRRILVVDDNQVTTKVFSTLLKKFQCEVETANDGARAIEIAATFQPEAVLLDVSMPGMDGYETCQRIRGQPWAKEIVLLAVTGWGEGETRSRAQDAGFDELVIKPVKVQEILQLVDRVFEKRGR